MNAAAPATETPPDLARSNSLVDLAACIRQEHEASASALKCGLEHAIKAGRLLIEAKEQLKHGRWLPWLKEHCEVPERTAQAYMRVARTFGHLDEDSNPQRVADLSFRNALNSLADSVEPEWQHAIRQIRREEAHRGCLDTPKAFLPSPAGRKIRVARTPGKRQWMLAIGPNVSRAALKEKESAARETAEVQELQREHEELSEHAAALEAEAKRVREQAEAVQREIRSEINQIIGPVAPYTETYDFQCDEITDAEIANLSDDDRVDRLLMAIGSTGDGLSEIQRGYWGDVTLMGIGNQITPGPHGGTGWTRLGSPEWLQELFPDWNEKSEERKDTAAAQDPDDGLDIADYLRRDAKAGVA